MCCFKNFLSYCIEAVDLAYKESSLGMTRKQMASAFKDFYDKALDFCKFQILQKLIFSSCMHENQD